jgi:hypothetical protein
VRGDVAWASSTSLTRGRFRDRDVNSQSAELMVLERHADRIVSLPGMMTGQILAGVSPLVAVRYQIVVMFMLASAVALAAAIVVLAYRRTFFTAALQLKDEPG